VGTNDALAHIPLEQFKQTVVDTIRWLKEHRVDVVLAGLQYVDQMAQDAQYRAVRDLMRNIAAKENVIIVRRYEAMRLISWGAKLGGDLADDEFDRVAASDRCLAQYFARAITVGVFGKGLRAPSPQFRH
jgi:acyl-CoA thioesterase I